MVVIAGAEPAVVHHETLYPDAGGQLGQMRLPRFVDRKFGGFP